SGSALAPHLHPTKTLCKLRASAGTPQLARSSLRCSLAVASLSPLLGSALAALLARSSLRCSLAVASLSPLFGSALAALLARSSLRCSLAVASLCTSLRSAPPSAPDRGKAGGPPSPRSAPFSFRSAHKPSARTTSLCRWAVQRTVIHHC